MRVERDDHAAARAGGLHRLGQRALGVRLERGVERELEVAAGGAARAATLLEQQAPAAVALHGQAPLAAAQPGVLLLLDAAHAAAVDVGEAEQARGQRVVRIDAARLLEHADADQVQLAHAPACAARPSAHELEAAPLAQAQRELARVEPEDAARARARCLRVADLDRLGIHRRRVDRERQRRAAAVHDLAARGRQPQRAQRLRVAALGAALIEEREVDGARREHGEAEHAERQRHLDAPRAPAHVGRLHGRASGASLGASSSITWLRRREPVLTRQRASRCGLRRLSSRADRRLRSSRSAWSSTVASPSA